MHLFNRVALICIGLLLAAALLVFPSSHLKTIAEVIVLVPLTAMAALFWVLAQTMPPTSAPPGSAAEISWKKGAGTLWSALAFVYLLGLGFVSADLANDQAQRYRDMADQDRRQIELRDDMDRYDRSGYAGSSYGDRIILGLDLRAAKEKEMLAMIGYGYMGLAIVPLIGFIVAARRRSVWTPQAWPQQPYGQQPYGQPQWAAQTWPQQRAG